MTKKKQVIVLYCATVLGLLIGVLNSVLNTRFLVPELYGDVRYVQNIISFISSLLLVGFFTSGSRLLALSTDEELSRRIRGAMCVILGATVFLLSLTMAVLSLFNFFKHNDSLSSLFFVSIFFGGNVLLLNYVNTTAQGDNHIVRIAFARLLPSSLYLLIAGCIFHFRGASPLLMLSLYNGLSVISLFVVILSTHPTFCDIKHSMHLLYQENKKYGFNVYLGSLASVSTTYIAGITLGAFCADNSEVGFYTLALTLAGPLSLLPSIVGTTYFKQFASQNKIQNKVLLSSACMTILSLVLFVLFIDYFVGILYNDNYKDVATYASILAISTSLHGLGDMFNRFLGAHGQGKMLRNAAFACGAVLIIGSFVFVYYWKIQGAIFTKLLGSSVYLFMMIFYYVVYSKAPIYHYNDETES